MIVSVRPWIVWPPSTENTTAGSVGAITYWIVHGIGGYAGAIIGFGLLVAAAIGLVAWASLANTREAMIDLMVVISDRVRRAGEERFEPGLAVDQR